MAQGTLYVVATPIGNMEDITLRALKVLKGSDLVAAEDTRHTRKLLSHYGIKAELTSYFEHNEKKKGPWLVERLKQGKSVALVTDAGTPGISDPGYRLIRLAVENSIHVEALPGASAIMAVISVSGLPLSEFVFKGFVPTGPGRRRRFFLDLKGTENTFIMFEAARRLKTTLKCILEILGNVEMVVAREMTKLHEEVLRGKAEEVLSRIEGRTLKGELTIVLRTEKVKKSAGELAAEIEYLLKSGLPLNEAVKALSKEFELPKREVYREALKVKSGLT